MLIASNPCSLHAMSNLVRHNASPMQLTWRPSRCVIVALAAMACLSAAAVASDMPPFPAGVVALAVLAWGLASALREHRRPPRVLLCFADGTLTLDASPIEHCDIHWRGPLAFLRVRDAQGRAHRLSFWPDTLDPPARRALRLALDVREPPPARTTSRRSRHEMRG